ncbi:hypothetical protein [Bacillus sp. FJAT-50079]|uniref:hypothetical protein n=1 Tax=Bacillus sp. FJAT-50079 TaxID=2833577 RepID=UPI001BC9D468|nr:hypothetical protein [Bacillus sp. FJAT-50079]MBS4206949.1 hypothetical protein [Bacillus sp. FJAT-50079]
MAEKWEEALLTKMDEFLYEMIMDEEGWYAQNPRYCYMLLYLTMRLKYEEKQSDANNEYEIEKLLEEIKEFQIETEKALDDLLCKIL